MTPRPPQINGKGGYEAFGSTTPPNLFCTRILIANARLEFPATATKQTSASQSNRKWMAFFPPAFLDTPANPNRKSYPRCSFSPFTSHDRRVTSHKPLILREEVRRAGSRLTNYKSRPLPQYNPRE